MSTKHVFIVGCKGIPATYGGYETFVDKLTEYHEKRNDIMYHVACKNSMRSHFFHHGADCFSVKVPKTGKSQAVLYDILALRYCYKYIKSRRMQDAIVYVLACRVGPWMRYFQRKFNAHGCKLYINPDGHEWKRKKWNWLIRKYWKLSERLSIKHVDMAICDNGYIEEYINDAYKKYHTPTTFIAYGAEIVTTPDGLTKKQYQTWLDKHGVKEKDYYLIVGRFVPENNFETVIKEVMASDTKKKLVIVATVNNRLYDDLQSRLHFESDERIKFVGTVYDQKLLSAIRKGAFAYVHGHEVGGTNPSLLESLGCASLSLVYDVVFNKEVCRDSVLYWTKEDGALRERIAYADSLSEEEILNYEKLARKRIEDEYSWQIIVDKYEKLFLKQNKER